MANGHCSGLHQRCKKCSWSWTGDGLRGCVVEKERERERLMFAFLFILDLLYVGTISLRSHQNPTRTKPWGAALGLCFGREALAPSKAKQNEIKDFAPSTTDQYTKPMSRRGPDTWTRTGAP